MRRVFRSAASSDASGSVTSLIKPEVIEGDEDENSNAPGVCTVSSACSSSACRLSSRTTVQRLSGVSPDRRSFEFTSVCRALSYWHRAFSAAVL